jgi:UDP-N-acetylmuramoyl-L-alanyl-D-glutamate--2,6-diaminopimelate ligase
MEVSSHALDQGRVAGAVFDTVVFTNLTQDHLDYHQTMDNYGKAKALLFFDLPRKDKKCVLNLDDAFGRSLSEKVAPVLSYGMKGGDIHPVEIEEGEEGLSLTLDSPSGEIKVRSSLIGSYNIYNILAAAGTAIAIGINREAIEEGIKALKNVPGRIERVALPPAFGGCRVFVDYAHTPDALERVVIALKSTTKRRLITLFGCGGDRDKEKRPLMGQASSKNSDFTIITSDNPRSEEPLSIIREIEKGVLASGGVEGETYIVIADRREAITEALKMINGDDSLLIAGKGHEDYQIIGNRKLYFDDRVEVSDAVKEMTGTTVH